VKLQIKIEEPRDKFCVEVGGIEDDSFDPWVDTWCGLPSAEAYYVTNHVLRLT
jgi:hypothetical protein